MTDEADVATTESEATPTSLPSISLDAKQLEAVQACCDITNRVVGVTGEPGTGKTTIMRQTRDAFVAQGYRVLLMAPTGKAAKRIFEATGIPAMTIHRALEYSHPGEPDPKTGKPRYFSFPRRNCDNKLDEDVIMCDEYSMATDSVHRSVFDALKASAVVRVFGDANQLQPIEKDSDESDGPSPFVQLLRKFPSVVLDHNYRQGAGSGIIANAKAVLHGHMPTRQSDFTLVITDDPVTRLTRIIEKCRDRTSFASIDNQIITPGKKSWVGTIKLNALLQSIYMSHVPEDGWLPIPRHPWAKDAGTRFAVGDKVIHIQNDYDLEVFNGETGIVRELSDYGEVVVDFGDRIVNYPPVKLVINRVGQSVEVDPRKNLELAYAITTHKAQGSEYQNVIYMLNKSVRYNCSRENFYTAMTRPRTGMVTIADQGTLVYAVQTTEAKKQLMMADWKRRNKK